MLLNLHVKNFALIEEADVEFGEGLNILTGETGAGKSLLIDAVNAGLGGRVRGNVIREGAESAFIEMVFSVPEPEKREALAAMDIRTEDGCLVLTRKILPGRSIHRINDETVTSAKVRKATALLIDIHGQQEHQSLIHREKHQEILDEFGGVPLRKAREKVEKAFDRHQEAAALLAARTVDPEERLRQMDFLQYEIREIEEADVRPHETEELAKTYRRMTNSQRICDGLGEVEDWMDGETGVSEQIGRAARSLGETARYDENLGQLMEELGQIEDLVSDFNRELTDTLEDYSYDPEEFRETQERLDTLHRLEQKYGGSCETIQRALEEKKDELAELADLESRREEAQRQEEESRRELEEAAGELTARRRERIPALRKELTEEIRDLNFSHVDFQISMTRRPEPHRDGQDEVEFLISLNEGEAAKPLGSVASGGELSRIMLAIKAALADQDEIPTLIFDEIDTGISGRTAQKVSEKLNRIGSCRQVICITHLPQIAAMADVHFCIRKESDGAHTHTQVAKLDPDASVEELARLLGGVEMTEAVYQNACEMKSLAKSLKKKEGKT